VILLRKRGKKRLRQLINGVEHLECRGKLCGEGKMIPITNFPKTNNKRCKDCSSLHERESKRRRYTNLKFIKEKVRLAKLHATEKKYNCPVAPNLEELVIKLWWKQRRKCAITGSSMVLHQDYYEMSIDRINSDLGYVDGNLQLVIAKVNILKGIIELHNLEELGIDELGKVLIHVKKVRAEKKENKIILTDVDYAEQYNFYFNQYTK
jgi:hypothetical protein